MQYFLGCLLFYPTRQGIAVKAFMILRADVNLITVSQNIKMDVKPITSILWLSQLVKFTNQMAMQKLQRQQAKNSLFSKCDFVSVGVIQPIISIGYKYVPTISIQRWLLYDKEQSRGRSSFVINFNEARLNSKTDTLRENVCQRENQKIIKVSQTIDL